MHFSPATWLSILFNLVPVKMAWLTPPPLLPSLGADSEQVTVSGLSSGAFMTVQLHIAHSQIFSGAGVFAGGIYHCAEGDPKRAQAVCMKDPAQIDVAHSISFAKDAAAKDAIDPLENLGSTRVHIFQGKADKVVAPPAAEKLREFYTHWMPSDRISAQTELEAAHGIPTQSYGLPCAEAGRPFLNKCEYDGVGVMLNQLYGKLEAPSPAKPENLITFNQTEFMAAASVTGIDLAGYAYIPATCRNGSVACRIHVALHGCLQSPEFVKDEFVKNAGYNEWAESNRLIVLYPSTKSNAANPSGCWDWWGYTGPDYATKKGTQIRAITEMVKRLQKPLR